VDGLAADITPAALTELAGPRTGEHGGGSRTAGDAHEPLAPGAALWFAVKAAEVAVHAAR
jgi:hypothetical protein